jgi:hypothetical protein
MDSGIELELIAVVSHVDHIMAGGEVLPFFAADIQEFHV